MTEHLIAFYNAYFFLLRSLIEVFHIHEIKKVMFLIEKKNIIKD
jgi:hypothetical protein